MTKFFLRHIDVFQQSSARISVAFEKIQRGETLQVNEKISLAEYAVLRDIAKNNDSAIPETEKCKKIVAYFEGSQAKYAPNLFSNADHLSLIELFSRLNALVDIANNPSCRPNFKS